MKRIFLFLILTIFLVAGCEDDAVQISDDERFLLEKGLVDLPITGEVAPDFTYELTDGTIEKLSDNRGKVVFLNFWATWCYPCKKEMPDMEELYYKMGDHEFRIIAISVKEPKARVKHFLTDFPYSFDVALDPEKTIGNLYNIDALPTTLIIDPEGKVLATAIGPRPWQNPAFISFISKYAKESK